MFYTELGQGRPLVLVHGWGSSGRTFSGLQAALSRECRVIAVDLRGFGRTGPVDSRHGVLEMAADVADLAERVGPLVVIGHSMGGSVVSQLAISRPDLVDALVVIDPAYGADEAECAGLEDRRTALIALGSAAAARDLSQAFSAEAPSSWRNEVMSELRSSDARVLLESFEGMYMGPHALGPRPQARRLLPLRRCPVLAIYSNEPAARTEKELSPCSAVALAPGPGHYVHLEHPAWTANTIKDWLRQQHLL